MKRWLALPVQPRRLFSRKPVFLCIAMLLFVFVSVYAIGFTSDFNLTLNDILALSLTCATILFLLGALFDDHEDSIGLDLGKPFSLYSCFFLFYYALPNWVVILSNAPARSNAIEICGLTAIALLFTYVGFRISGYRPLSAKDFRLTPRHVRTLLFLFYLSIPLTIWYQAWRISIGAFYTHAQGYEQEPTLFAAFMENFAGQLQMPMILLLGLIYNTAQTARMKRLFFLYCGGSLFIALTSSQFRLVASTLLFMITTINLTRKRPLQIRTYLLVAAGGALSLFLILGVRSVALHDDWSGSQDQLSDSMSALTKQQYSSGEVHQQTFERALNQQNLLSDIITSIDNGHQFLYGELLFQSAYSVIPRFLWPGKPSVVSMQRAIRTAFNLRDRDDSPGPLLEFYANGGWLAVAIGFLLIGYSLGRLTRATAMRKTIGLFLALAFYWGATSVMEGELIFTMIVAFRVVMILAFCGWIIHQLLLQTGSKGNSPSRVFEDSASLKPATIK